MKQEDVQQALARLEKLLQQGHVSQALFDAKKQELEEKLHEAPEDGELLPAFEPEELSPLPAPRLDTRQLSAHSFPETDSPPPLPKEQVEQMIEPPPFLPKTDDLRTRNVSRPMGKYPPFHAAHAPPLGSSTGPHLPKVPLPRPTESRQAPPSFTHFPPPQRSRAPASKPPQGPPPPSPGPLSEPPVQAGDVLRGRYRLVRTLGKGGMGQVFLVEDLRFGGTFAAKVLHPWIVRHEPTMSRFVQEFKIMEKLLHPGIVRTFLLDEDPHKNALFYLMEFIQGKTLQRVLESAVATAEGPSPFTLEETLDFLEKMAEILCYTHAKGILHRDLKPTNIMLYQQEGGRYGIKLLDFGLAKWMTGSKDPTLHTGHTGTFFYIAPEQLMGGAAALVAADIFSLGVILYQMLTGALPVAMAVPPSEINPSVPKEIDQVMRKAMHAHWQVRHQSVKELLQDFARALGRESGESPGKESSEGIRDILHSTEPPRGFHSHERELPSPQEPAAPEGYPTSERYTGSSIPATSASMSTAAMPTTSSFHDFDEVGSEELTGPTTLAPPPSTEGRRRQPTRTEETVRSRHGRQHRLHSSPISNAERIARLRSGGPRSDSPHEASRPPEISARRSASQRNSREVPRVNASSSRSRGGSLKKTGAQPPLHSIPAHEGLIRCVAISPEGRFTTTLGDDGLIHLWDTSTWYKLHTLECQEEDPLTLAWSPVGDVVAVGCASGLVQVWKILDNRQIHAFSHMSAVHALVWSLDGMRLVTGCEDASLTRWVLQTGNSELAMNSRHPNIRALAHDSRGSLLASGSSSPSIKIWNLAKRSLLSEFKTEPDDEINALSFSPQEALLLSASKDGVLRLWDIQSGVMRAALKDHRGAVTAAQFAPSGEWFASCGYDHSVRLWRTSTGECLQTLHGHEGAVLSLAISPQGKWLASVGADRSLKIWDTSVWN